MFKVAVQELIQETSVKLLGVAIDDKVTFMNTSPAIVANWVDKKHIQTSNPFQYYVKVI